MRKFIKTACDGTFYESLIDEIKGQTREVVKAKVFQVLYGNLKVMKYAPLSESMRQRYPTVYEMLASFKREKGHAWVGQTLQRREAHVVIGGVCGRLMAEFPNVPIITVHDSLMTTPGNVKLVHALLRQEFARHHFQPRFRVKGEAQDAQEGPQEALQ